MSDLISREAALDCFHDWVDKYGDVHTADEMVEYRKIEELPAVQRVENVGMRWIPCDKRLPNDTGECVFVTVLDESGDYPYRYVTQGWMIPGHPQEWVVDGEYRRDVVAWMPNPRPWKGGRMMDDYISRQAAIDAVREYIVPRDKCAMRDISFNDGVETAISALSVLPSAQPRWIPVSERMPENNTDILLQFKSNMGVGFFEDGWAINTGDGIYCAVDELEEKPIAWMPLPEPYKEESNV